MGLYLLLAEPVEWELLYNCSFYSVDSIPLEERKHPYFAAILFFLFVIYEILYAPCLYAMCRKNLRTMFCYQLMIEMAIFDMLSLPLTAFIPSIYTYYGLMYCSAPKLNYVQGSFMFALWIGYSTTTLILAVNRCLAITNEHNKIFDSKKVQLISLWISPIATVLVLFFSQAVSFNSVQCAYFFNPHLGYHDGDNAKYASTLHTVNNFVFSAFLPLIYAIFFWRHRKIMIPGLRSTSRSSKNREVQLFIQTLIISVTIALASAVYMVMQYAPVPRYFVALSQIGWIVVEGAPPIVYLTMNKSIRRILMNTPSSQAIQPNRNSVSNGNPDTGTGVTGVTAAGVAG